MNPVPQPLPLPVPVPTPTQTVNSVIAGIDSLLASAGQAALSASVVGEIATVISTLLPFLDEVFPGLAAVGRESQREDTLYTAYNAGNMAGLLAYKNDVPAHPKASLAICDLLIAKLTALQAVGLVPVTTVSTIPAQVSINSPAAVGVPSLVNAGSLAAVAAVASGPEKGPLSIGGSRILSH
jgi:hypothetical protein